LNAHIAKSGTCKPAPEVGALVHIRQGKPVTDSLAIAREFGRPHKNVLKSIDDLIADGTISGLEFKPRDYTDERGKKQRLIELAERGALIAMPFIGGKNSRVGQVRLVDAFLALRAQLSGRDLGDWTGSRKKVSISFQDMCYTLNEVRAETGKATSAHHYANESKLVNWVLFGSFEASDRDNLEQADLTLMERVEARNAIWIARGRSYDERKAALPAYLQSLRAKPASGIKSGAAPMRRAGGRALS
jgi:Rha family phage regulatory protein